MGKLIIVGTSIGNLEDLSLRSIRAVFEGTFILAEDTRVFYKLKNLLKERKQSLLLSESIAQNNEQEVWSYREQNHDKVIEEILKNLRDKDIYLFSDSGMPLISDPGWNLVEKVIEEEFEIDVLPGPTALISALSISGLPTDKFSFLGFLPRKDGKAIKILEPFLELENTVILYESPFRVLKLLKAIDARIEESEDIKVAAVAEITKKFQKALRGNIKEVILQLQEMKEIKGEWVICLRKD